MQTKTITRSPLSSSTTHNNTPAFSPKKKTMSVTQTYYLAHKARAKLSSEAARSDHNLRLLVGHANLLDSLMLELADAEREQESWFNQSVRGASAKSEEKHIQWADTVIEEPEEDWEAEDAESDSSDSESEDEEDVEMADAVALHRVPSNKYVPSEHDDIYEDDEEDYANLSLTRSPSHSASPPELEHDSDSSEDESMPPSPPSVILPSFSDKKQKVEESFYEEQFYLPQRNPARLVSAISVY
jgi:hypothetical protein